MNKRHLVVVDNNIPKHYPKGEPVHTVGEFSYICVDNAI